MSESLDYYFREGFSVFYNFIKKLTNHDCEKKLNRIIDIFEKSIFNPAQAEFIQLAHYAEKRTFWVIDLKRSIRSNRFTQTVSEKFMSIVQAISTLSQNLLDGNLRLANEAVCEVKDGPGVSAPQGSVIERNYCVDGVALASEKISRIETLPSSVAWHRNMAAFYAEGEERTYHAKALEKAEKLKEKKGWLDSNYFRNLIGAHGDQKFSSIMEDSYVSAPINLRYHEFRGDHFRTGFFRLGVITDLSNGWTNLQEMKEMLGGAGRKKLSDKIKELRALKPGLKTEKMRESAAFAIAELQNLETAICRRRNILQDQMLQLLSAQLESNPELIHHLADGAVFPMVHLSLLNEHKDRLGANGWRHNERNQMLDMCEIFREFQGREIIFDDKGPLIDDRGAIHMPKRFSDGPRRLKLDPVFLNISVQGKGGSGRLQSALNREGLLRIFKGLDEAGFGRDKHLWRLFSSIWERLEKGESNYALAEDLAFALLAAKLPLSKGCMSAKDRTGLVAALVMQDFLSSEIEVKYPGNPEAKSKMKDFFARKILDEQAPAARVVQDNTGETVLKCSTLTFPKISLFRRGIYLIKQVRLIK